MKITIREIAADQEEELILCCHGVTEDVTALLHRFAAHKCALTGFKGEEIHKLTLSEVFYFEVVENRSFIYTKKDVFETKLRLYEFEALCRDTPLFRASKSMILNSDRIDYITPTLSGRFEATFTNGEKAVVSRQYVGSLKKMMGL